MAQRNNNTKTDKKTEVASDCFFSITAFSGSKETSLQFLSQEDFIFPPGVSLSFELCPVQNHGQAEESSSFLKSDILGLNIQDFIKLPLEKICFYQVGANIHGS